MVKDYLRRKYLYWKEKSKEKLRSYAHITCHIAGVVAVERAVIAALKPGEYQLTLFF